MNKKSNDFILGALITIGIMAAPYCILQFHKLCKNILIISYDSVWPNSGLTSNNFGFIATLMMLIICLALMYFKENRKTDKK